MNTTPPPPTPHTVPRRGPHLTAVQRLTMPLVRWYASNGLPRFGHLMHRWGVNRQDDWTHAPIVEIKDRQHGHHLRLDLADFFQRLGYFMSEYHEQDVLSVLLHGVRTGDHVLDGGANIGLITLFAAGVVGPTGRVDSFEPSPELLPTLRWHLERNTLDQVTLHEAGISDEHTTLTMSIPTLENTGAGTLGSLPNRYGDHVRTLGQVITLRGDDVLDPDSTRPLFIKLDIEGFELKALRGLESTIERRKPAILCEMIDEMLNLNGDSSMDILSLLHPMGYCPFGLDRKGWRQRHKLHLHPLKAHHLVYDKDVLWLHPDGPHWDRFVGCIQPPGNYFRHHHLIAQGACIPM